MSRFQLRIFRNAVAFMALILFMHVPVSNAQSGGFCGDGLKNDDLQCILDDPQIGSCGVQVTPFFVTLSNDDRNYLSGIFPFELKPGDSCPTTSEVQDGAQTLYRNGGLCGFSFRCIDVRDLPNGSETKPEISILTPKVNFNEHIKVSITDHSNQLVSGSNELPVARVFLKRLESDGSKTYITNDCVKGHGFCLDAGSDTNWGPFTSGAHSEIYESPTNFKRSTPGTYFVEYLSEFNQRVESGPITVCEDPTSPSCLGMFKGRIVYGGGIGTGVPDLEVKLSKVPNDPNVEKKTRTDALGNYEFDVSDLFEGESIALKFTFTGREQKDQDDEDVVHFSIVDGRYSSHIPISVKTKTLTSTTIPEVIDLNKTAGLSNIFDKSSLAAKDLATLNDAALAHDYAYQAVKFGEETLGINMARSGILDYKVLIYEGGGTRYNISGHAAKFSNANSKYGDLARPDNVDWHEFAHAFMTSSKIGGEDTLPTPYHGQIEPNHGGYANLSTTDSWKEGFAEWLSIVLKQELKVSRKGLKPWHYSVNNTVIIDLEKNIKPWQLNGKAEELALAGLLWDLYDSNSMYSPQKDDDNISVPIKALWDTLNVDYLRNVGDIYDLLIEQEDVGLFLPKEDVDNLFISHGFFVDTQGNRKYDAGEVIGRAGYGQAFKYRGRNGIQTAPANPIRDLHDARYHLPLFDELLMEIDLMDQAGNPLESETMTFTHVYDSPTDPRNYSYTADVKNGESIGIWVGEDTTLQVSSATDQVLSISGETFEKNIETLGNQGAETLVVKKDGVSAIPPEEAMTIQLVDESGNRREAAVMTFELMFDSPSDSRNTRFSAMVHDGDAMSALVPEGATLQISSGGNQLMTMSREEFNNNVDTLGNQGSHTFMIKGPMQSFSDVPPSHRYFEAIEFLKEIGFIEGYSDGTFRPNALINRAEFMKIIIVALLSDIPSVSQTNCFPDVIAGQWFHAYVCYGQIQQFISGYPNGLFQPSRNISFTEAAKIIVISQGISYQDHPAAWFVGYLEALIALNAIPEEITEIEHELTRGQLAEIMYRLLRK